MARECTPNAAEAARSKAAVRRQLAERGAGTYIGEMVVERDSALARWHDLKGVPLKVWIQPESDIDEWRPTFATQVRDAFLAWDSVKLPVRFAFVADSASADVHVTFVHTSTSRSAVARSGRVTTTGGSSTPTSCSRCITRAAGRWTTTR